MGLSMRQTTPAVYPAEIDHPTCPLCRVPMWLTRIEPIGRGKETRTFECRACGNSTSEIVDLP
jgi:hypothetical protein